MLQAATDLINILSNLFYFLAEMDTANQQISRYLVTEWAMNARYVVVEKVACETFQFSLVLCVPISITTTTTTHWIAQLLMF